SWAKRYAGWPERSNFFSSSSLVNDLMSGNTNPTYALVRAKPRISAKSSLPKSALLLSSAMTPSRDNWMTEWLEGLGRLTLLTRDSISSLLTFKIAWQDLLFQIYFIGVKSQ